MDLFIQLLLGGLVIGSTYAVVAIGFTLTFTVLRVVNFAHPEVFMIGMFGGLVTANLTGNLLYAVLGGALTSSAVGMVLERVVIRPLRHREVLMTLIATFGVGIALQNFLALWAGPDPVPFRSLVPRGAINLGDISLNYRHLFNFIICAAILCATSAYVRLTIWGRATQAVAEKPDVAAAFGINIHRISQVTLILASAFGGVAGVSVGMMYGSAWAYIGIIYGLKSFVCMLVAGDRFFEGVILVAVLLGVIESLVTGYLSSGLRDATAFAVLIAVLMVRPQGLFGSYSTRA